jgi:hypothetical protein
MKRVSDCGVPMNTSGAMMRSDGELLCSSPAAHLRHKGCGDGSAGCGGNPMDWRTRVRLWIYMLLFSAVMFHIGFLAGQGRCAVPW